MDDELAERRKIDLGRRIREIRRAKGISQEGLAALADIDRGYMGHIERGAKAISVLKVWAIADALGVGPAELFEQPQSEPVPPSKPRSTSRTSS